MNFSVKFNELEDGIAQLFRIRHVLIGIFQDPDKYADNKKYHVHSFLSTIQRILTNSNLHLGKPLLN